MESLLKEEKFIREALMSNDIKIMLARNLFLWHFKSIDSVEKTMHSQAIKFLYMSNNTKRTKQNIADEIFTNVKSFATDRKLYAEYFFHFYNYVVENKLTEETAITSLIN